MDESLMLQWAKLLPELDHLAFLSFNISCQVSAESWEVLARGLAENQSLTAVTLPRVPKELVNSFLSWLEPNSVLCDLQISSFLQDQFTKPENQARRFISE
jgi:hypothetical protein